MADRLNKLLEWDLFWLCGLLLAAGLAISWVLRGAPVGQSAEEEADEDAPRSRYRDRVVAAAVAGLLLIAAGAYIAASRSIPGSLPLFAAGFAIVVSLNRANRRYRHASPSLRRVTDASGTALNTALLAGILIVGNVLAFKYGGKALDFTRESAFTLSSLTTNQLRTLDRPVTFTVVFGQSELAAEQRSRILQLLELYQDFNPPKVKIEQVNPFRDRERYEDLVKYAPDLAVVVGQGGGVLVDLGEGPTREHAVVRNSDLFALNAANPDPSRFDSSFRGEDAITSALIRLREGKKFLVAFLTGHGEPSIHDVDVRTPALGMFRSRLESLGARVVVSNLLTKDLDPAIEVALLCGPRTPFQPQELERLKAYVDGGGQLLLAMGPESDEASTTGLVSWLKGYDVEVGPGVIWDAKLNYANNPRAIIGHNLSRVAHPVVDAIASSYVILPDATPVRPTAQPANPALSVTAILKSSPDSWVRTDRTDNRRSRGDKETSGPFDVAVAVATRPVVPRSPEVPRMVVLGSRDVANNPYAPRNFDLLINTINWLRGRPYQQGLIPPTPYSAVTLSADAPLRAKLVVVPTLMAISVIVGFGIATYLARRD